MTGGAMAAAMAMPMVLLMWITPPTTTTESLERQQEDLQDLLSEKSQPAMAVAAVVVRRTMHLELA